MCVLVFCAYCLPCLPSPPKQRLRWWVGYVTERHLPTSPHSASWWRRDVHLSAAAEHSCNLLTYRSILRLKALKAWKAERVRVAQTPRAKRNENHETAERQFTRGDAECWERRPWDTPRRPSKVDRAFGGFSDSMLTLLFSNTIGKWGE